MLAGRGGRPKFLKDCPAHADLRIEALMKYAEGDPAGGDALLDKANAEATLALFERELNPLVDRKPVFGRRAGDPAGRRI